MDDHLDPPEGPRRSRQQEPSLSRANKIKRAVRPKKKNSAGFGGVHQRRNKHWSW